MTNFEKIKAMTVEEMAEFMVDEFRVDCLECECMYEHYDYNTCLTCIKHWLESEVSEVFAYRQIKERENNV